MKEISILDIYQEKVSTNQTIKIYGWVRNRRHSNIGISFIDIYDGSCVKTIQLVIDKNIKNYKSEVLKINVGCAIYIEGKLVLSVGKNQDYEVKVDIINVIGWVNDSHEYPISSKNNTLESLREIPHLRSRTNLISVVSNIRHNVYYAIQKFLNINHYYWIPTPIITSLDAEGAGKMFNVSTLDLSNVPKCQNGQVDFKKDFFGKRVFLTVSGQLTLESYACSMKKVYTFGPIFRAENSNTTRHLAEFWMLEVEQSFSDLDDIINLSNNLIRYIINYLFTKCIFEIDFLFCKVDKTIFNRLENFLSSKVFNINYEDAIKILSSSKKFDNIIEFGFDLSSDHERYLVDKYFNGPVIIKNYPKNLKPFYMRVNSDNRTVAAMDLLLPNIGEIIGGSQREERIDVLKSRLLELELNIQDYNWYLDLRRYGSIPHSGFGLGFERLMSYITGIKNVKDLIPFHRTVGQALY